MTAKKTKGAASPKPTSAPKVWTDTAIRNLKQPKLWRVDRNLYLRVSKRGEQLVKYWVFRWRDRHQVTKGGHPKVRDLGLAHYGKQADQLGLAEARAEAAKWRAVVRAGGDPKLVRAEERAAGKPLDVPTFAEASALYIAMRAVEWSNPKHVQQWANTLRDYADPIIGELRVDQVSGKHLLAILEPIWVEKHETATRVRQRIEAVLAWAEAKGYRSGENPARRDGPLAHQLPKISKAKIVKHHASLAYGELAAFVKALRDKQSVASAALEFVVLTAARVGEAVAAEWSEFDLDSKVWTVPASRMKADKPHRVPLSDRALEIVKQQQGQDETFVFPSPHQGKHISDASLLKLAKSIKSGITVHGFRSTFKTWAAEQTSYPRQVVEFALAHVNKDSVESAYLHSDLLPKRVPLMAQWSEFIETEKQGEVVSLHNHKEGNS